MGWAPDLGLSGSPASDSWKEPPKFLGDRGGASPQQRARHSKVFDVYLRHDPPGSSAQSMHPSLSQWFLFITSVVSDPMDCSTPSFPVLNHLLELAQTHIHQVSDAIQPSHPLLSPSPPALSPSQHQGLFQ